MTLVVPKDGLSVPDPARHDFLPPEGREIDLGGEHLQHWARRIDEGDVSIKEVTAEEKAVDQSMPENAALPLTRSSRKNNSPAEE